MNDRNGFDFKKKSACGDFFEAHNNTLKVGSKYCWYSCYILGKERKEFEVLDRSIRVTVPETGYGERTKSSPRKILVRFLYRSRRVEADKYKQKDITSHYIKLHYINDVKIIQILQPLKTRRLN